MLVSSGANLNTSDRHGAYPLHYAAQMCGSVSEMGVDSTTGLKGMLYSTLVVIQFAYLQHFLYKKGKVAPKSDHTSLMFRMGFTIFLCQK